MVYKWQDYRAQLTNYRNGPNNTLISIEIFDSKGSDQQRHKRIRLFDDHDPAHELQKCDRIKPFPVLQHVAHFLS